MEALLRAGNVLGREDFIRTGLETLDWIVARQTSPEAGSAGFGSQS